MYATKFYIVGDGLCIRKVRHINFSKAKIVNEKLDDLISDEKELLLI